METWYFSSSFSLACWIKKGKEIVFLAFPLSHCNFVIKLTFCASNFESFPQTVAMNCPRKPREIHSKLESHFTLRATHFSNSYDSDQVLLLFSLGLWGFKRHNTNLSRLLSSSSTFLDYLSPASTFFHHQKTLSTQQADLLEGFFYV